MKNHAHLLFSSILLCILLSSCSKAVYYSPSTISDIGLAQKGDIVASVSSISVSNNKRSSNKNDVSKLCDIDMTVAFAPTNNLGLYFNTYGYQETYTQTHLESYEPLFPNNRDWLVLIGLPTLGYENFHFSQRMSEAGIGYFTQKENIRCEVYGFHARGNFALYNDSGRSLNASMFKTGLRSALVYEFGPLEAGLAVSLSGLRYDNIHAKYGEPLTKELDYIEQNRHQVLMENGFNFKYKLPGAKVKIEFGKTRTRNKNFRMNDRYVGLGLVLEIDDLIRKITSI